MKKLLLLSFLACGISYGMDEKEKEWLKIGRDRLEQEAAALAVQKEKLEVEKSRLAVEEVRLALACLEFGAGDDGVKHDLQISCNDCGASALETTYPYSGQGAKLSNIAVIVCKQCKKIHQERPFYILKREARERILNYKFSSK